MLRDPGRLVAGLGQDVPALHHPTCGHVDRNDRHLVVGEIEHPRQRLRQLRDQAGLLLPGSPGATLYGPVKSYLIRVSQSLHIELRSKGVHVTALCPGFTYSEFHDVNNTRATLNRRMPAWMWMGADEVAAAGYEAAEANRPLCVPGVHNQIISVMAKLFPDDWVMTLMQSRLGRFRGL